MQFSNTTTKDGIIQHCEIYTDLGDGFITTDTTLLKSFTALVNKAYNQVVGWILDTQSQWEWDDSNYTDFPIGTTDLVDNQQDYTLPAATTSANFSTFLKIIRVQVKDIAGNWIQLKPFDERKVDGIALEEFMETKGVPEYYRETGNSIELYPKPDLTKVDDEDALEVYFQRTPDQFTSADTTQEAGIPLPFQPLIPLMASMTWLKTKRQFDLAKELQREIYGDPEVRGDVGLKGSLEKYYSNRNQDVPFKMVARSQKTSYN